MLKLLVLLMIHDFILRYLMLKIVTHYSLTPIVYMTGQKLTTWFLTPKNLSIYLFSTNVSITSDYVSPNFYVIENVNNLKDLGIIGVGPSWPPYITYR